MLIFLFHLVVGSLYVAQSLISSCSSGTYLSTSSSNSCSPCPAGHYCLASTTNAAALSASIPCGMGTSSSVTGATSNSTCVVCGVGTYSISVGVSSCSTCPSSSYCVNGIKNVCAPGYYQSLVGQGSCNVCSTPVAQYYTISICSLSANTVTTLCSSPGNGFFSSKICFAGTALTLGSTSLVTVCASPTTSQFVSAVCSMGSSLALGSNSVLQTCAIATTGYTLKKACVMGNFNSTGAQATFSCSNGYFGIVSISGLILSGCSACSSPPTSFFTSSICSSSTNTIISVCSLPTTSQFVSAVCSMGSSLALGSNSVLQTCAIATTGYTLKKACVMGNFNSTGAQAVFQCSNGYGGSVLLSNSILSGCSTCAIGFFKSGVGNSDCELCSSPSLNYFTSNVCTPTSNTLFSPCITIYPVGYVINTPCSQGNITFTGTQSTFLCDKGYGGVAEGIGLNLFGCSICPEGTFKSSVGNFPCQQCLYGYFSSLGSTICSLCENGYCNSTFVESNKFFSYNLGNCRVSTFPLLKSVKASSIDLVSTFIVSYAYLYEGFEKTVALNPNSSIVYDSTISQSMLLNNPSSQINVNFVCLNKTTPCNIVFDVDFECVEVGNWMINYLNFVCGSSSGILDKSCSETYCNLADIHEFNLTVIPEIASCGSYQTPNAFQPTGAEVVSFLKLVEDFIYEGIKGYVQSFETNGANFNQDAENGIVNWWNTYFGNFTAGILPILEEDLASAFDVLKPDIINWISNNDIMGSLQSYINITSLESNVTTILNIIGPSILNYTEHSLYTNVCDYMQSKLQFNLETSISTTETNITNYLLKQLPILSENPAVTSFFSSFVLGAFDVALNDWGYALECFELNECTTLYANFEVYASQQQTAAMNDVPLMSAFSSILSGVLDIVTSEIVSLEPYLLSYVKSNLPVFISFASSKLSTLNFVQNELNYLMPYLENFVNDNLRKFLYFVRDELPMSKINSIDKNLGDYFNKYFGNYLLSNWNNTKLTSDYTPEVTWLSNSTALFIVDFVQGSYEFFSSPTVKQFYVNTPLVIKPQGECPINSTHAITGLQVQSVASNGLFQIFTYVKSNNTSSRNPLFSGGYTSAPTNNYSYSSILGPASEISIEILCADVAANCFIDYEVHFLCIPIGEWLESPEFGACTVPCDSGTKAKNFFCNSTFCDLTTQPIPLNVTFCNTQSCTANEMGFDKPCLSANNNGPIGNIPCNDSLSFKTTDQLFPIKGCLEYERMTFVENVVSVTSDYYGSNLGKRCDLLNPVLYGKCSWIQPAAIFHSPFWQSFYFGYLNKTVFDFANVGLLPRICNCTKIAVVVDSCAVCDSGWILSEKAGSSSCVLNNGKCSTPRDGFFVTSKCALFENGTIKTDTQIEACLEPAPNQYVTKMCSKGDAFTLGKNTKFDLCSYDVIPQPFQDPSLAAVSSFGYIFNYLANTFVNGVSSENACTVGSAYQLGHGSFLNTLCVYANNTLVGGNLLCSNNEFPMIVPPNIFYQLKYALPQKPNNPTYVFMDCPKPVAGETFTLSPCFPGEPNRGMRGGGTFLSSCRYPNLGEFVQELCFSGGTYAKGRDIMIMECSNPREGFFVQNICQNGVPSLKGVNTYIVRCSSPSVNQYVISPCKMGTINNIGQDTVLGSCSTPLLGWFIFQKCVPGNFYSLGLDTMLKPCSNPSTSQYAAKMCSSDSDTLLSDCVEPVNGFNYTYQTCSSGAFNFEGKPTQILQCSQPQEGVYVSQMCISGSSSSLGKDSFFSSCFTLLNGVSSWYISTTCISGSSLVIGKPNSVLPCTPVPAGYFQIVDCVPGSLYEIGFDVVQNICPLGFSCSGIGLKTSEACPLGTYSDSLGGVICKHCGDFMTTLSLSSTNSTDCVCISKYYLSSKDVCIPCQEGLNCDDGMGTKESNIQAQDGSYLSVYAVNETSRYYVGIQCEPPEACVNNTCAVGYKVSSFLCSTCDENYYRSGSLQNPSHCFPCDLLKNHFIYYGYLSLTFICASFIVAFLVYNSLKKSKIIVTMATNLNKNQEGNGLSNDKGTKDIEDKGSQYSALTRVVLSQLQLLGLISDFHFTWPSIPKMTMDAGAGVASSSMITSNFAIQSSIKCLLYYPGVPEPVNNLLVVLYTFIICMFIVCLFWLIRSFAKTGGIIFNDRDRMLKLELSLIALCYMSYGKIFSSTIQLFACKSFVGDRLGNVQRLEGAYDVVCMSPQHLNWIYKLVLPVFFFVVILFPLYALFTLIRKGEMRYKEHDFLRTYGFIYAGYNEQYWWYEWISLLRKLSISFTIIFIPSSSDEQVYRQSLIAVFILGLYLASLLVMNPYKDSSMNRIESIALGVAILTFYLGLWTIGNSSETVATLVSILFFALNGLWLFSVARLFFKEFLLSKYLSCPFCKRTNNNNNNISNNNKIIGENLIELSQINLKKVPFKKDDLSTNVINPLSQISSNEFVNPLSKISKNKKYGGHT